MHRLYVCSPGGDCFRSVNGGDSLAAKGFSMVCPMQLLLLSSVYFFAFCIPGCATYPVMYIVVSVLSTVCWFGRFGNKSASCITETELSLHEWPILNPSKILPFLVGRNDCVGNHS